MTSRSYPCSWCIWSTCPTPCCRNCLWLPVRRQCKVRCDMTALLRSQTVTFHTDWCHVLHYTTLHVNRRNSLHLHTWTGCINILQLETHMAWTGTPSLVCHTTILKLSEDGSDEVREVSIILQFHLSSSYLDWWAPNIGAACNATPSWPTLDTYLSSLILASSSSGLFAMPSSSIRFPRRWT